MKQIVLLLITLMLFSCSSNSLKKEFNCKGNFELTTKEYHDVLKKFTIELPETWKTQMYYDEYSSEIFSADTTKALSESYIFDASWKQGELNINDSFTKSLKDSLKLKEELTTVRSGILEFNGKPGFWNLSKGTKMGHTYHYLQIFVKTGVDDYITSTTKVFGNENVDERLCESVTLFDNLNLIK